MALWKSIHFLISTFASDPVVCARVMLRFADVAAIARTGTPFHDFIAAASKPRADLQPGLDSAHMWDPLPWPW